MLPSKVRKNQLITRRTFLLLIAKLGLLGVLASRIFYLQILKSSQYKILSEKNRINIIMLPSKRGKILDCKGNVLAVNQLFFRVLIDKNILAKNNTLSTESLYKILELTEEEQENINEQIFKAKSHDCITIAENISWQQLVAIEEQALDLPGVYIDSIEFRTYPYSLSTSHILGYTSLPNSKEKSILKIKNANINIGKVGVEKSFEEELRGTFGFKKVEVNAHGLTIRELDTMPSTSGQDLALSIDINLQNKLYEMFNNCHGAAILTETDTGKIKALISAPGYDTNSFSKGVNTEYWQSLNNDPYKPLINKASQSLYPPGSIFKLITILAALEYGIDPKTTIYCNGKSFVGNKNFCCWYHSGHGNIDMANATKHSCNSYMYYIAKIIGPNNILSVAKKLGFGNKTGINLLEEIAGFLPTPDWKRKKMNSKWMLGDTLNISIGQGYISATPLQLARMITSIANGEKLLQLSLIQKDNNYHQTLNIDKKHIDFIHKSLKSVVNEIGGTAYSNNNLDIRISGKTGTAQVKSKKSRNDDFSKESIPWQMRNHGLFVGFAPSDNPKYAISVIVEHGKSGAKAAAPIAKNILAEALQQGKEYI